MTGVWEKRLQNIAYGQEFSMPAATQLVGSMEDLSPLLERAADEPGVTGESGDAASKSLRSSSQRARDIVATTQRVQQQLELANGVRTDAQQDLAGLSGGSLSARDETLVRTAAAGATIFFPGFSVVAGEGAVSLINWFLGNNREDAAKKAVQTASERLDQIAFPEDLKEAPRQHDEMTKESSGVGPGGGGPGSGGPGGGSFGRYSDAALPVIDRHNLPDGIKIDDSHPDSGVGIGRPVGSTPGSTSSDDSLNPVVVAPGQNPSWTTGGDGTGGGLTPNGPATGGTTWGTAPGGAGFGPGGSSVGDGYSPGSGSGLLGSVATGGAVAGTSGAALLGGAKLAQGAGFVGAPGAAGGGAGSAGVAAGGLGGRPGAAGSARAGGLLGGTRAGQGSGASAAASGGGAGSRSGMVGAGGRPGSSGGRDRDRQEGRGLGGPIAPHLEDDDERGPRSAAAGAGGRE